MQTVLYTVLVAIVCASSISLQLFANTNSSYRLKRTLSKQTLVYQVHMYAHQ